MRFLRKLSAALALVLGVGVLSSTSAFAGSDMKYVQDVKGAVIEAATNMDYAPEVSLGQEYTSNFETSDYKYVKFTVPSDGQVSISCDLPETRRRFFFCLYTERGTSIFKDAASDVRSFQVSNGKISIQLGLSKGSYYWGTRFEGSLELFAVSNMDLQYRIDATPSQTWVTEPNYTEASAFDMKLNTLYKSANIRYDYYTFNLDSTDIIKVYFSKKDLIMGAYGKYFVIMDSDGGNRKEYYKNDADNYDPQTGMNFFEYNPQKPGKYYLALNGNSYGYVYEIMVSQANSTPKPVQPSNQPSNRKNDGTIYRMFNPLDGDHIYTMKASEADALASQGWEEETSPGKSADSSGVAIYRLSNPASGEHLFSADKNECRYLVKNAGWQYDNGGQPAFYGVKNVKAVYRLFNPNAASAKDSHHYTLDVNEITTLTTKHGWQLDNGGNPVFYLQG